MPISLELDVAALATSLALILVSLRDSMVCCIGMKRQERQLDVDMKWDRDYEKTFELRLK